MVKQIWYFMCNVSIRKLLIINGSLESLAHVETFVIKSLLISSLCLMV